MGADHIEELALIAMSRLQRTTLERYFQHCLDAGETEAANEVLSAIAVQDEQKAAA